MAGARPPDAAAARRFCALPRDLQGSAVRTREGPCGGCGRAGGSAGANGHGRVCRSARPWPRVRIVSVHDRRGRARRRDGPALPHPTSHGRAFASFLCTIAAGVRRLREGPALPHPTSHGRAFASFLCTIAAGVRSSGRGRARRRDGPALLHPTSPGRAFAVLKFIPCAGRICAYSRCAAAASASAQSVRSQGRSRSARPKWP